MPAKPPLDTLRLLSLLNGGNVDFIVIGATAAIAHGSAVITQDLDVCAPLGNENAVALVKALEPVHPRWRMRPDLPLIKADNPLVSSLRHMYFLTDAGQIDVLGELPGVCSFAELKSRIIEMPIAGIRCQVIDIDTVIEAKRLAARPQDWQAVRQLEVIKQKRRDQPQLFPE